MAARTLQELVAAAASLHADRTAVRYDGGSASGSPGSLLRYRDLVGLAGELARALRGNCSPSAGVVGLYCSEDLFTPVWILGILQTPAAYAPLDPEAPGLLTARVLNRCGLKYCAVKTELLQRFQAAVGEHASVEVCASLPKFKLTLVRLEPRGAEPAGARAAGGAGPGLDPEAAGLKEAGPGDLAYVLHTSGTTGLPKIVRVPHKCILPNILHLRSLFQMSADDVVLLASPLTFDPSVVDVFLALSSGAQLLVIPAAVKKTPSRLARLLFRDHETTVLQVTPTLLGRFGRLALQQEVLSPGSSLRLLALGGESCPPPALLGSWRHEDNRTHIYNLYGVTEVSCWASAYRVPEALLQAGAASPASVPLGTPLMDTTVEVRDDHGDVVTEGEGQVFIGGEDRVCLLDDEEEAVAGTMRATGDWVEVRAGQMFLRGRRDRLVKRHGKRVDLDGVQQLISGLPQVEACAVGLHGGVRLLAFVVASASGGQSLADPAEREEGLSSAPPTSATPPSATPPSGGADGDLSRLILNRLSLLLPAHSVPDTLVLVPALNLTPHGKVDLEALMKTHQRQRRPLESSRFDSSKLKRTLWSLWREALALPEDAAVDEASNFLSSGGDSLKALLLHEDVLAAAGTTSPALLEVILDGTFKDVLRLVERAALTAPGSEKRPADERPADERHADERHADERHADERHADERHADERHADERHADERHAVLAKRGRPSALRPAGEAVRAGRPASSLRAAALGEKGSGEEVLGLELSWSSDTGRCVDASPVLLPRRGTDAGKTTVFIGSHSHRIQALDLTSGGLLWERVLGGRIEASAAVSRCGSLVVIGCYDGGVYFLSAESGETRWTFQTGDAVKSRPAVDPLTGLVVVGSHDGHVYALDPEAERCVWRRHCGGGAVFSSPCLHPSLRQLYAATLGGRLLCLNPDNGDVLWSHRRGVPFFSSPDASSGRVAIGSVDGNICCFSHTGALVWQFLTEGPVFSSPRVTPDQQGVLCGSHDGRLHCVSLADGAPLWAFRTSGKVYSSPCVLDGGAVGRRGALVVLASTDGALWVLDARGGRMLASLRLPGELFSSPVAHGRSLVVGCRNDFVYCLNLTVKEGT